MGAKLTSITGLQNLTNLERFHADDNSLVSANFSGLSNLIEIEIGDNDLPDSSTNSLSSINVSGCTALRILDIDDSNFSAGFPDLSDCTSLRWIDVDQSDLVGSIDLSNLPALEGFDVSGNTELTEVIISSTQPLGDDEDYSINLSDCALTQTAVDNILVALASGSISDGSVNLDNDSEDFTGTNAAPGVAGRESLLILSDRGWSFYVADGNHTMLTLAFEALEADICASTNTSTYYIADESSIAIGNKLYTNQDAWNPADAGWYRLDGDGSIKFEVSGTYGEIISVDPCGA
jgi:hypothetical protein